MGKEGNDVLISELRSQQHVFCAQDKPRDQAVHPNVGNSAASASGASGGCTAHGRRASPTCACWPEQKALEESQARR